MKKLAWEASSFGNDFGVPLGRVQRFLGKNFNDPCRGAENLRWDMTVKLVRTRSKKSKNKSIVEKKTCDLQSVVIAIIFGNFREFTEVLDQAVLSGHSIGPILCFYRIPSFS